MQRRNFLIGVSGTAVGGSALLGTGAFSRVESQRDVTIQVAEDPDAYLGLSGTGSINSDNYVDLDQNGHLAIDIGENPNGGMGVNSDSFTYFDGMVQVCNQGKEGVGFYINEPSDDDFPSGIDATGTGDYEDDPRLQFYTGEASGVGDDGTQSVMGEDNAVDIPVGECIELGIRTMTKGVDATTDDPLFGDELTLIADVDVDTDLGRQSSPVRNARTRDGYGTIRAAIDDAGEGDTIEVLSNGPFEEQVIIRSSVTVKSIGGVAEITNADKTDETVSIRASDVELDGFKIKNTADEATGAVQAVAVRGDGEPTSNVRLRNLDIDGSELTLENPDEEDNTSIGLYVRDGSSGRGVDEGDVSNVEIESINTSGFDTGVGIATLDANTISTVELTDINATGSEFGLAVLQHDGTIEPLIGENEFESVLTDNIASVGDLAKDGAFIQEI